MRAYKHLSSLAILCLAGAAMMVAGCVKGNLSTNDDLQFTAQSSIETKAVYGSDAGDYQRIIWQDGDEVTIASDQAQTLWGRSFCDYIVTPEDNDATASTRESKGRIKRKTTVNGNSEDSGLRWNDNASGTANFWSVYPATNDAGIQSGIVNATISSSTSLDLSTNQPSGNVIKILDPRKGSYPMVAHGTADANTNLVKLQYYPAFTAFQITLFNNTNSQITLKSCSLSSTTSNLSGTFTASIDALATDAPSHPVLSNLTGEGKTVTVGVTDVLDNGKGVTFSIFCLPQDLTDLTFNVTYIDSNGEQSRSLRLEQNDTALTFEACKQHRFSLTLTEVGLKPLTLGGAQMLLNIIFNNRQKLIQYLKAYYNLGPGQESQEYRDMLSSLLYKLGNWTINTDHYNTADLIFNGTEEYSLTPEELAIIQGFLATVTVSGPIGHTADTKLTSSVISSDFDWVPNLQEITSMDAIDSDANPGVQPVDVIIENNSKLSEIHLEHFANVLIDNCDGLAGAFNIGEASSDLSIINTPNNSDCYITIRNCDNITEFYDKNRDFSNYTLTFENNASLQKIRFEGQKVRDIIVSNCDSFTTLQSTSDDKYPKTVTLTDNDILEKLEFKFIEQLTVKDSPAFKEFYIKKPDHGEAHLTHITLDNTPVFELGAIGVTDENTSNNIAVDLTNCAHNSAVTPAKLAYYRNEWAAAPSVNRIQNADNVKLYRSIKGAQIADGYTDPVTYEWIPPVYEWTYVPYE